MLICLYCFCVSVLKPAVWTPMCTLYWSHSRLGSFKRDWGLSPADVFSEEGKHHCATVKANNQSHLQGPQRKLSTNDSVSPDTFALLPCKDNILLLLHKLAAVAVNMCSLYCCALACCQGLHWLMLFHSANRRKKERSKVSWITQTQPSTSVTSKARLKS